MRFTKFFLIIVVSCILLSCSLVKTAYNKAPELAIWWLDDYFSLSQAQNLALKPALQNLHNWHRKSQLPNYLILLQDVQTSLTSDQLSANTVCEKLDFVRINIQTLQMEAVPIIIEIAPSLSDKQLERFKQKLARRTEKWKNEWWQKTKPEQIETRLKKTTNLAQDMYGDLSESQINQLKHGVETAEINPEVSYKEIIRRNNDALDVLNKLQKTANSAALLSQSEKYSLVKTSFERIQKSPDFNYQNFADALTKHTCETFSNLHNSTTTTQKLHAKNWLQGYIDLIIVLQMK